MNLIHTQKSVQLSASESRNSRTWFLLIVRQKKFLRYSYLSMYSIEPKWRILNHDNELPVIFSYTCYQFQINIDLQQTHLLSKGWLQFCNVENLHFSPMSISFAYFTDLIVGILQSIINRVSIFFRRNYAREILSFMVVHCNHLKTVFWKLIQTIPSFWHSPWYSPARFKKQGDTDFRRCQFFRYLSKPIHFPSSQRVCKKKRENVPSPINRSRLAKGTRGKKRDSWRTEKRGRKFIGRAKFSWKCCQRADEDAAARDNRSNESNITSAFRTNYSNGSEEASRNGERTEEFEWCSRHEGRAISWVSLYRRFIAIAAYCRAAETRRFRFSRLLEREDVALGDVFTGFKCKVHWWKIMYYLLTTSPLPEWKIVNECILY